MRYKLRLQCETLTKQGKRPCNAPGILMKNGRIRCKVHGGYSSGPKTAEGKKRSIGLYISKKLAITFTK